MLGTSCSAQTEYFSRRKEGSELVSALPPQERKARAEIRNWDYDFQHPWVVPSRGPFNSKIFVVSSVISPHLLLCRLSCLLSVNGGDWTVHISDFQELSETTHFSLCSRVFCVVTMWVSDGKEERGLRRPQPILQPVLGPPRVGEKPPGVGREAPGGYCQGPGRFPGINLSWFLHYNLFPLKQKHI